MTGQVVGNRIKKLEDSGVIIAFSLQVDEMKVGLTYTAFIIIFMKTANHDAFIRLINDCKEVVEVRRLLPYKSQIELSRTIESLSR